MTDVVPPTTDETGPDHPTPHAPGLAGLPRWELALAGSMVAIGLLVRLWPRGPLWLDEALSVNIARVPFGDLGAALKQDGHPPLYYALLHLWTNLAGTSTFAVRALSIVLSLSAIPLLWLVARRAGGIRVALWSVAVWAVLPYGVRYGTETRMYVLVMVLVLAGWWVLDRLWTEPRPLDAVAFAAVGSALLWTHYWALWLLTAVGLATLLRWWLNRREPTAMRELLFTGGALGVAGLTFLPWVPTLLFQAERTGTPWGGVERPTTAVVITIIEFAGQASAEPQLMTYVLVLLVAVAVVGRSRPGDRWGLVLAAPVRRGALWALGLAAATLLIGSTVAMLGGATFVSRYAAVIYPIAVVLVGWGLAACPARLRGALALVVLAGSLVGIALEIAKPRTIAGTAAEVIAAEAPDALVVTCPDQLSVSLRRELDPDQELVSYPDLDSDPRFIDWVDYEAGVDAADPAAVAARVWQVAGDRPVVLGSADTYETHRVACPAFLRALSDGHETRDLLVATGADAFEHLSLLLLEP
ncbi:MAG: glycosyltransferase family 39 protein [Microthrixaceae bacterium]